MNQKINLTKIFTVALTVAITCAGVYFMARAGDLNPAAAPGDTMKTLDDIYCKIANCTPVTYGLDSPASATSTMHTLQEIYDALPDYSLQKNRIWDDWKGSASSTSAGLAYAYANSVDQNNEEAVWASTTDTNLNGALVASGNIKRDTRTGLYWSDCYDATSGGGSCDTRSNSFALDGVIVDADDGLDAEGGLAVDFCEALSLDADGDGVDETDWYLPSQKELMQSYINGSANNIPNPAYYYWSSTEGYGNTSNAWYVYLYGGNAGNVLKTNNGYARCVHR